MTPEQEATKDSDMLKLAESILAIYAPYGYSNEAIKRLAVAEVERWKADGAAKEK